MVFVIRMNDGVVGVAKDAEICEREMKRLKKEYWDKNKWVFVDRKSGQPSREFYKVKCRWHVEEVIYYED